MFNVACELSLPMGKTEFSSTAKKRTNSVSWVRKACTNWMLQLCMFIICLSMIHPLSCSVFGHLGPVVQSIVSLTSSLRGQLVKCFAIL